MPYAAPEKWAALGTDYCTDYGTVCNAPQWGFFAPVNTRIARFFCVLSKPESKAGCYIDSALQPLVPPF
jgi:hypothetical protein